MTGRYLIVALDVALQLGYRDDLDEALEDAAETFAFPAWEEERPDLLKAVDLGVYSPDVVVLDLEDDLLYAPDRGEVVVCWWDGFASCWRRILEVSA